MAETGEAQTPSLWSARPLSGGSVAAAFLGWSTLGAAYAQGVTARDDLGGSLSLDYERTEFRLSGFWRRPIEVRLGGSWDSDVRLGLGWYVDSGGRFIESTNRGDRGVELEPAVMSSRAAAGGVVSLALEVPFTFTFWRGGGLLARPSAWCGYETPLWRDLTLGARLGLGWRAGTGGAPLSSGSGDVQFWVVSTYRVF
jgi:hypothetical protein